MSKKRKIISKIIFNFAATLIGNFLIDLEGEDLACTETYNKWNNLWAEFKK